MPENNTEANSKPIEPVKRERTPEEEQTLRDQLLSIGIPSAGYIRELRRQHQRPQYRLGKHF